MLRLPLGIGLVACLALTGLFNYATTCCCGDPLLLELIAESCGHDAHAHDRERLQHHSGPLGAAHACYKAGSQAFLEAPDGQPGPEARASHPAWAPDASDAAPVACGCFLPCGHDRSSAWRPPPAGARLGRWLL